MFIRSSAIYLVRIAIAATTLWSASLADAKETIVAIVGDSTVANYNPDQVNRGWGQILSDWAVGGTKVVNLARSGSSSKSFRSRGLWAKALEAKPNVILIQFGHNDRSRDEKVGTQPDGEFRDNLKRYVTEARSIGAKPIFVTPPVPRVFHAETGELGTGKLTPYVAAMKKVGAEEEVPVLDLFERSSDWYRAIGREKSFEFSPMVTDINHYNQAGAEQLARLILLEAKEKAPELNQLFVEPAK